MARFDEPTDEIDGDEDLVVTDHRDPESEELREAEEEPSVETTVEYGSQVLEEYGEDVASSPAQRGQEDLDDAGA